MQLESTTGCLVLIAIGAWLGVSGSWIWWHLYGRDRFVAQILAVEEALDLDGPENE